MNTIEMVAVLGLILTIMTTTTGLLNNEVSKTGQELEELDGYIQEIREKEESFIKGLFLVI